MKPLGTRIIAVQKAAETTTRSGLLLGDTTPQTPIATVTTIGPDVTTIKTGQSIIYQPSLASVITLDKKNHLVINESDVIAILSD